MNAESKDLEIEVCGLNDLMRLAAQDVQSTAEAKGHNLQIKYLEPDISVEVDKMKMITAFTNILNNAVKFTPDDGKIMMQAAERNTEVWIRVRDTGVGIPEENLTSIFKSFSQVEDHMIRRHGGMGLGLSIAKAVVEAHGGRIWAESEGSDQGSSFTISLPKS
jgi:signal transduction histidine kinase